MLLDPAGGLPFGYLCRAFALRLRLGISRLMLYYYSLGLLLLENLIREVFDGGIGGEHGEPAFVSAGGGSL